MKKDVLGNAQDAPWSPARECFVITPDDNVAVDPLPKAIRAGGAGTITLRAIGSTVDVAHPVLDGEVIPVHVEYVRATGTDVDVIGYG